MNKSQENANAYLQALAPGAEQRAALDQHLSHQPRSVEDVHLSLAGAGADAGEGADAALRSVAARLDLGWREGEHKRAAL
ncbi:MAG: hypothetical protein ACRCR0_11055, partial [Edwardsiella piscicida]